MRKIVAAGVLMLGLVIAVKADPPAPTRTPQLPLDARGYGATVFLMENQQRLLKKEQAPTPRPPRDDSKDEGAKTPSFLSRVQNFFGSAFGRARS